MILRIIIRIYHNSYCRYPSRASAVKQKILTESNIHSSLWMKSRLAANPKSLSNCNISNALPPFQLPRGSLNKTIWRFMKIGETKKKERPQNCGFLYFPRGQGISSASASIKTIIKSTAAQIREFRKHYSNQQYYTQQYSHTAVARGSLFHFTFYLMTCVDVPTTQNWTTWACRKLSCHEGQPILHCIPDTSDRHEQVNETSCPRDVHP